MFSSFTFISSAPQIHHFLSLISSSSSVKLRPFVSFSFPKPKSNYDVPASAFILPRSCLAQVSRLMNLIFHSLYSHKKKFFRELVSNASDALDKLRFLSVTDASLLGDAGELEIRIKPDPEKGTITISDTGIGMTREELIDCLGTTAQSGTSKFLSALKKNKDLGNDNSLIGQFGVGFYSAFLVAEKVRVSTKSPTSDKQHIWEVAADSGSYVIKEAL